MALALLSNCCLPVLAPLKLPFYSTIETLLLLLLLLLAAAAVVVVLVVVVLLFSQYWISNNINNSTDVLEPQLNRRDLNSYRY